MDYPHALAEELGSDTQNFLRMMRAIEKIGGTNFGVCDFDPDAIRGGDLRLKYRQMTSPIPEIDQGEWVQAAFSNVKDVMQEQLSNIDDVRYPALEREKRTYAYAPGVVRHVSSTVKIDIESLRAYVHAYALDPERFVAAFGFNIAPREDPSLTATVVDWSPMMAASKAGLAK